ncbi:hypothetical protein [Symbiobacterium thermophilum]|uniref:Transcriptional regulator n=2 Tax=Symbiobacterium thermophilum TaxID=2734 RepID=Q67KL0_SYMTH|nr:hypothetical protein [Symbiobacterium thermophilum]MBY6276518.1 hypothetical protein [Symbiobacterium thermophilum]OTA42025.1 MAG: hypothetical protein A6D92_02065 [Symbiobacterium thermophilum]BAD41788.1 conserved hypothetical protein [Symbiobacterium thermophilum IAM 14863]
MSERAAIATSCYDHLGGPLGERLARRLMELGWVTAEPAPGVTPEGWGGFARLGLDLSPLPAGRRKPVALCGKHIGAHLGFLLRRHLLEAGWIERTPDGFALTPAGEEALRQLGVDLED